MTKSFFLIITFSAHRYSREYHKQCPAPPTGIVQQSTSRRNVINDNHDFVQLRAFELADNWKLITRVYDLHIAGSMLRFEEPQHVSELPSLEASGQPSLI